MLDKVITKILGDTSVTWDVGMNSDSGDQTLTANIFSAIVPLPLQVVVTKKDYYPSSSVAFVHTAPELRQSFRIHVSSINTVMFNQAIYNHEDSKNYRLIEIFWHSVLDFWENRKKEKKKLFADWLNS